MRPLDPQQDLRYVVRVEVYSAVDEDLDCDGDRDHLQEIQDILDGLEEEDQCHAASDEYQKLRFDLCRDCRKRFLRDPMGRKVATQFDFSKN
jgi:hypothetical protein